MFQAMQLEVVHQLSRAPAVAHLMRSAWAWPIAESLHFVGLSLLVGSVVLFDLRLLGLGRAIPIAAMHRLIPFGLAGFVLNLVTGLAFLLTDATQYIYNPSFLWKMAFVAAAGANALTFYLTVGPRTIAPGAPPGAPRPARLIAAISLALWMGVVIAGRLLTFYRPFECAEGEREAATIVLCEPAGSP